MRLMLNCAWCVSCRGVVCVVVRCCRRMQVSATEAAAAYTLAVRYNTWLYAGILANALIGVYCTAVRACVRARSPHALHPHSHTQMRAHLCASWAALQPSINQ